jgi:outer membrane receptor protein involved in Fe transport
VIRTSRRLARIHPLFPAALFASTALAGAPAAFAAPAPAAAPPPTSELIVTAEKREENVQKVPLSIQVLGGAKLDQLQIKDVNDYVKFLPSVSVQNNGPGFVDIYMRGVASGENNNHSGPLPTTATYLDEAPITTIGGALDIHVFDIARVEALAGPQGTLYGASSEAGTLRIITNKPRLGITEGEIEVEGNTVDHGGLGYVVNGMSNFPLGDKAAIRLVGWAEHDAGYIDNVHFTRTYPSSGIVIDNKALAKDDFNDVNTYGGRLALKVDLNENWTVEPQVIFQDEVSHGVFGYEPAIGDLKVAHFSPDKVHDRWFQAALTIEGKIGAFDVTYAGSYMKRDIHSQLDYSDYSYFYDTCCGYGAYIYDSSGALIDPSQYIHGVDRFTKQSHELRFASPADKRARIVAGLFYERQTHAIQQRYIINDLSPAISVPGWPDTIWLTEQQRVDRDYAAFGEASFDITHQLTLTGGVRVFRYDNSLVGFFGFGSGFSSHTGVAICFAPAVVPGSPCTDLDKRVAETNFTHKLNLTYHFDDNHLIYATWSRGFRPGGINRRGTFPPYVADFLTNYEAGWKTSWLNGKVRFNGAIYLEEWKNFQFSFLGQNGLTNIRNAPQAEIKGVEAQVDWRPDSHWSISASAAYNDAKLTQDLCIDLVAGCTTPDSPKGTQLPVSPKFKANATIRYEFPLGPMMAHLQTSVVGQTAAWADLRVLDRGILGQQKGYTTVDFVAGVAKDSWTVDLSLLNATDTRADVYRTTECEITVCGGAGTYISTNRPRTLAIRISDRF